MTDIPYLNALRREHARKVREAQQAVKVPTHRLHLTDQIRAVVATLPPAPVSLDLVRSRITGRYGRPPTRGETAAALIMLGYTQRRIWRNNCEGRRYWVKEEQQ